MYGKVLKYQIMQNFWSSHYIWSDSPKLQGSILIYKLVNQLKIHLQLPPQAESNYSWQESDLPFCFPLLSHDAGTGSWQKQVCDSS